jgi:hypothetical protein
MVVKAPRRLNKRRFYAEALSAAERASLDAALDVEGVDEEIAALRLRLRTAIEKYPQDLQLMLRGLDVLRRLVVSKYGLSQRDGRQMTGFAEETLRRIQARGEGAADDA